MASIQARIHRDQDGKQRTVYRVQVRRRGFPPATATFDRRSDAAKWAKATETDMHRAMYFPEAKAKGRTLEELADRQLESTKVKRPHDYARHELMLGHWKERLGKYTLGTPNLSDLIGRERDRMHTEDGMAPATVNRYLSSLSKAFSNAVKEWKWLAPHQNPMPGVAKLTEPKGRERFLSDGERLRLLDACRKSGYAPLYLMMLLSVTTGMRRGEMLKLTWTDIDLDRRDEQGNPDARATLRNTKNGDTRVAALIPEVVSLLREHGKVRMLGNDLVFCAGGAPEVNDFDEAWYRALKDAKVKNFRWHDLRHTAASYAAMSGATLPELAAMLGHRQMSMVARYSHLTDQHVGKVVTRMAAKFFS